MSNIATHKVDLLRTINYVLGITDHLFRLIASAPHLKATPNSLTFSVSVCLSLTEKTTSK